MSYREKNAVNMPIMPELQRPCFLRRRCICFGYHKLFKKGENNVPSRLPKEYVRVQLSSNTDEVNIIYKKEKKDLRFTI